MQQLNRLLWQGNENRLREELYNRIRPLFPPYVLVRNFLELELNSGYKLVQYEVDIRAGKFCEECKEPCCCTCTPLVALNKDDIKRLGKHGITNVTKDIEDHGYEYKSIDKCAPCRFLSKNKCTIYSFRPAVCERYPMQVDCKTGKPIFYIAGDCCVAFNLIKRQIIDAIKQSS